MVAERDRRKAPGNRTRLTDRLVHLSRGASAWGGAARLPRSAGDAHALRGVAVPESVVTAEVGGARCEDAPPGVVNGGVALQAVATVLDVDPVAAPDEQVVIQGRAEIGFHI